VIADYGLNLPASLKKKDHVSIIRTPNYGMLSSLYAILEKYGTSPNVRIILVDEATTYMPHLASEYLNTSPEMLKQLKSKITESNASAAFEGAVFGLSGILYTEDKQNDLDKELNALLEGGGEVAQSEKLSIKRSLPSIIRDTSTVDLLEFSGSIFLFGSHLEGFKNLYFNVKTPVSYNRFQATVFLSNFLAKKHIYRVNVCHLANNRFIMERIGCFSRLESYKPTDYWPVIQELYSSGELYICQDNPK
jgi:hypothetical protein